MKNIVNEHTSKLPLLVLVCIFALSLFSPVYVCAYGNDDRDDHNSGGGVGGAFWGSQRLAYPWEEDSDPYFGATDHQLDYVGGMGYGISRDGHVAGGFGVGFSEHSDGEDGLSGGFGGVISGRRIIDWPINVLWLIYAGVGGVSDPRSTNKALQDGVFAVMGETTLEASLPMLFFHPTIYVGYQAIASVGRGDIGEVFLSYAPTIGFRLLWGSQ